VIIVVELVTRTEKWDTYYVEAEDEFSIPDVDTLRDLEAAGKAFKTPGRDGRDTASVEIDHAFESDFDTLEEARIA
jgi:hypothetical protein